MDGLFRGHKLEVGGWEIGSVFLVVIERDEDGWYVATVLALRGCHIQARTLEELIPRIREAIALYLEVEEPETPPMQFVGVQQVDVAG